MLPLSNIKKIAVGSKNPVKIQAVKTVLSYYLDHDFLIEGISAPSGVSDMPLTKEETLQGGKNRTEYCMKHNEIDVAFGVEGGVYFEGNQAYLFGVIYALDSDGYHNHSFGGSTLLPSSIAIRLKNGEELGPLMDELRNTSNTKQGMGAVGFFSKGRITRQQSFENIATQVLTPWLHPELYA